MLWKTLFEAVTSVAASEHLGLQRQHPTKRQVAVTTGMLGRNQLLPALFEGILIVDDIEDIKQAVSVCSELQAWLDAVSGLEQHRDKERILVGFHWVAAIGLAYVTVDELFAWHHGTDNIEDLTFEFCRSRLMDSFTLYADLVRSVHPSPFSEPFTNPRSSMGLPKQS